ncbi:MAG TPA: hypothetical protein DCG47_13270 [Spirochaetaceae bacterium]|nr:hypothetical protein [Spirochaetaceae bacterium]
MSLPESALALKPRTMESPSRLALSADTALADTALEGAGAPMPVGAEPVAPACVAEAGDEAMLGALGAAIPTRLTFRKGMNTSYTPLSERPSTI